MVIKYRLRRLSLLDQWRMDSYRIIFCILVMIVFSAVILWILPLFAHGNTKDGFIGMFCGIAVNFWLTCISRLHIDQAVDIAPIVAMLENKKYRKNPQSYFELNGNRYLTFKSQRVFIHKHDNALVLVGPYNILRKVTKLINVKS